MRLRNFKQTKAVTRSQHSHTQSHTHTLTLANIHTRARLCCVVFWNLDVTGSWKRPFCCGQHRADGGDVVTTWRSRENSMHGVWGDSCKNRVTRRFSWVRVTIPWRALGEILELRWKTWGRVLQIRKSTVQYSVCLCPSAHFRRSG